MAGANFGQVSCVIAVPAYYLGRYFAVLDSVYGAATAPALSLKERVGQFSLAGCAPGAWGPGLRIPLVLLSVPRGIALHGVRFVVILLFAALGPVPALCFLADELPRDPHPMAA